MIPGLSQKRPKLYGDPTENQIQRGIIDYMRKSGMHRQGWTFYHCPNSGQMGEGHKINAWKLGQLSGVPDIAIITPTGQAAFIEVKIPSGKLSPHQETFHAHCEAIGIPCEIARSVNDAELILRHWGLGRREAAA